MSTYIKLESPRVIKAAALAYRNLKGGDHERVDAPVRLEQLARAASYQTEIWVTLDDLQLFQDHLERVPTTEKADG